MQSKYVHVSRKKDYHQEIKIIIPVILSWPSAHFCQNYFLEEALDRYA